MLTHYHVYKHSFSKLKSPADQQALRIRKLAYDLGGEFIVYWRIIIIIIKPISVIITQLKMHTQLHDKCVVSFEDNVSWVTQDGFPTSPGLWRLTNEQIDV